MICPNCHSINNRVLETRMTKDGDTRRRRQCTECDERFSTVETILKSLPYVAKKDGRREPFSQEKLKKGLQLACMKRPISLDQIEDIVKKISSKARSKNTKEIGAYSVGQAVMEELKKLDDVAYVRFASVYKNFKDIQEFVQTLNVEDKH